MPYYFVTGRKKKQHKIKKKGFTSVRVCSKKKKKWKIKRLESCFVFCGALLATFPKKKKINDENVQEPDGMILFRDLFWSTGDYGKQTPRKGGRGGDRKTERQHKILPPQIQRRRRGYKKNVQQNESKARHAEPHVGTLWGVGRGKREKKERHLVI